MCRLKTVSPRPACVGGGFGAGHTDRARCACAPREGRRRRRTPRDARLPPRRLLRPDPEAVTLKTDLWKAWKGWCDTEGARTGTNAILIRNLRAAYPDIVPGRPADDEGNRTHVLYGISLALGGTPDADAADSAPSGVADAEDLARPSGASRMSGVEPTVSPNQANGRPTPPTATPS